MEERLDVMIMCRDCHVRPIQGAAKNFADTSGRRIIEIWAGAEQNQFPLGA
jgi:hypothetical protein